jgi:hypothetical protein
MTTRESDPTPNALQKALLGYDPTPLEDALIKWSKEHWQMAARGVVYATKEAADTISGVRGIRDGDARVALEIATRVSIAEREYLCRAIAAVLPQWLADTYGLEPKDGGA